MYEWRMKHGDDDDDEDVIVDDDACCVFFIASLFSLCILVAFPTA